VDRDERKVLEALEARPLMAGEIQGQTSLEAAAVTRLLLTLQAQGLVTWDVTADRGVWMLTSAGQDTIGL